MLKKRKEDDSWRARIGDGSCGCLLTRLRQLTLKVIPTLKSIHKFNLGVQFLVPEMKDPNPIYQNQRQIPPFHGLGASSEGATGVGLGRVAGNKMPRHRIHRVGLLSVSSLFGPGSSRTTRPKKRERLEHMCRGSFLRGIIWSSCVMTALSCCLGLMKHVYVGARG